VRYYNLNDVQKYLMGVLHPWVVIRNSNNNISLGKLFGELLLVKCPIGEDLMSQVEVRGVVVEQINLGEVGIQGLIAHVNELNICPGVMGELAETAQEETNKWSISFINQDYKISRSIRGTTCHQLCGSGLSGPC